MAMVYGEGYLMILTLVNGLRAKHMGMEFTHGKTATGTKENGTCV